MSEATDNKAGEDAPEWIRKSIDEAVERITSLGIIPGELVQARPVWSIPFRVMIGQLRDTRDPAISYWIIAGAGPTDFIESSAASTPRDAARHFSLKWQLDAARYEDPAAAKSLDMSQQDWGRLAAALRAQAEALYELVDNDELWRQPVRGGQEVSGT